MVAHMLCHNSAPPVLSKSVPWHVIRYGKIFLYKSSMICINHAAFIIYTDDKVFQKYFYCIYNQAFTKLSSAKSFLKVVIYKNFWSHILVCYC